MPETLSFRCIECGERANDLFTKGARLEGVKPSTCEHCKNLVDQYVEFDTILVVLDLMLLKKRAFSHVLFNIPMKAGVLKLWVMMLFADAYYKWWRMLEVESIRGAGNDSKTKTDYSRLELQFYALLLQKLVENIFYYAIMTACAVAFIKCSFLHIDLATYLKSLLFGKFARLYVFAVYIWSSPAELSVCIFLLEIYVLVCRYIFIACCWETNKIHIKSVTLLCFSVAFEYFIDNKMKLYSLIIWNWEVASIIWIGLLTMFQNILCVSRKFYSNWLISSLPARISMISCFSFHH